MVAVRPAVESDRITIAEINKHYDSNLIHLVHNTWQQQGSMYIAEIKGKGIGFCGLVFPAPTEAQILGIRLLPDYRKEQTGRDFIIALMQVAQGKGCNVVRMLTSSENYETQAALQRNLSFERCGTWVIGYGEELSRVSSGDKELVSAPPELLEDIWSFLQYSQAYQRSQGLIYTDLYTFRSFSLFPCLDAVIQKRTPAGVPMCYLVWAILTLALYSVRRPFSTLAVKFIISTATMLSIVFAASVMADWTAPFQLSGEPPTSSDTLTCIFLPPFLFFNNLYYV